MMATNTPPPRSAPITASSHDTAPVPRLTSTPATIPGSVIAFGMIWSWRSMAVIAMSAARSAAVTTKRAVGPNAMYAVRNAAPVSASTTGYRHEIDVTQAREREEREVVVPRDRRPAARTRRARTPEAPALGQPRDHDVQEAADDQA